MSNIDKKILKSICDSLKLMTEQEKENFSSFGEGLAMGLARCHEIQREAEETPASV